MGTDTEGAPGRGGPLAGVRVLELGGIGPGPFCGMVLADMGADVIRVERPGDRGALAMPVLLRGRRSVALDLKDPVAARAVRSIAERCDALIEGFRPGVTERLGLGPEELCQANPRLVYARMTGWGQDGPHAQAPGHDINYLALSGALHTFGPADGDPVPPLNLVADFGGGGMLLALGVVSALLRAQRDGRGQVVDASMVDGTALLLAMTYGFLANGLWTDQRGVNLLDGSGPFYRVYRCRDQRHVAVGCLEEQFRADLLRVLGLTDDPDFATPDDRKNWPVMNQRLEQIFTSRTRDNWAALFEGTQACVTPVLSLNEAAAHPHNLARGTYLAGPTGIVQPSPAPRFGGTPSDAPRAAPTPGEHTAEVLAEAGLTSAEIAALTPEPGR
ncbi:carnitine dehydratase [Wenjunlia vitaminophila]|uniref:Carnitine dehydratase n=1 Tax=Wenjunlia vitaminophila TaxID=76728 RepID=A3R4S6_WENVI|nr:CaiB/BaiF CoA-transferase family protein [Wenjunlia vitaminophila]ABO15871.1 L-carnitine dehydratase [Wenjunlia vitaminophila]KRV49687.1 carnitine dehydratase [Wenjunlia vitaminophila]